MLSAQPLSAGLSSTTLSKAARDRFLVCLCPVCQAAWGELRGTEEAILITGLCSYKLLIACLTLKRKVGVLLNFCYHFFYYILYDVQINVVGNPEFKV